MSRPTCQKCTRPISSCFCSFITVLEPKTKIIILQHPSEVKHALGTAKIAKLCFKNSELFIGEDFSTNKELNSLFSSPDTLLLFPGEDSFKLDIQGEVTTKKTIKNLIVLDGTWKKAKKIYYLSKKLQSLPKLSFENTPQSNYKIRKEPHQSYLSTLESIVYALNMLENEDFSAPLKVMDILINEQIDKMGIDHYSKYYSTIKVEE